MTVINVGWLLIAAVTFTAAADDAKKCSWSEVEHKRNYGNEAATLTDKTLDGCKAACESYTNFECISIEFNINNKYCYLQKVNRYTHRLTVSDTNYVYADLNCDGKQ